MSAKDEGQEETVEECVDRPRPLPDGYRAALVTAITVFLGFSLYFLRFWGLENPGQWTLRGFLAACVLVLGIVFQLIALYRALNVQDNHCERYARTVRCFFVGVSIVVGGLIATIVISGL